MRTLTRLQALSVGLSLLSLLGTAAFGQAVPRDNAPAAAGRTVRALPVVEEEEPVKPAKPGAPVVEEEEPVRPAKPGAPVVEEEEPIKPGKPGAPVVEEEEPVKSAAPAQPAVIEDNQTPAEPAEADDTLLKAPSVISIPRLDLRMFADVGYEYERERGEAPKSGFQIGAFDIFASSKLNDKVSVLAEALFERAGNEYFFDLERVVLRYRHNKYLNFDMGRFHSSMSYYNSTYHHGRWFETSAERPFIAEWEDDKGILPSHAVGLQISGALPSPEVLPISYFVEVSNGRGFAAGQNGVQSGSDTDTGKATNIGLVFKPAKLPGLQIGTSVYRDTLRPGNGPEWNEKIFAFHAVYQRGRFQILNEAVHLRHQRLADGLSAPGSEALSGKFAPLSSSDLKATAFQSAGPRSSMSGFYSQFGYRIGKIVPFTRLDWLNAPGANPVARAAFGEATGLRHELAGGFFYDLSSFSALKFQVDRVRKRGVPEVEAIFQLAFAF